MDPIVIFTICFFSSLAGIAVAGLVSCSDWYEHRRALRQLRYDAELRAYRRALQEAEREDRR